MRLKPFLLFLITILFGTNANAQITSFAPLVEKLLPSVVSISTTPKEDKILNEEGFSNSPKVSLGSGFILDAQGYILTNNHVVEDAQSIRVKLFDDEEYDANLIGVDKKTDLALIKINTQDQLSPVTIGNSDNIRIGDWIIAIGNPFGLGNSVSAGIVSAKSRDIESGPYDSFIQTDASINQGSSGGPMFDVNGEVIGINTAIFSETGGSQGVGFAFPINVAKYVIQELKNNGKVDRGWIGVKIQPSSKDVAASLGLEKGQGVLVSSVNPQSPAQISGLEAGDIITKLDDNIMDNTKNLSRLVAETPIGTKLNLEVWRNKEKLNKSITVEKMPEEDAPKPQAKENKLLESKNIIGIEIDNINENTMDKYSLETSGKGVVVTLVDTSSDAYVKGLKEGDVIIQVDKKDVLDKADFDSYIDDAKRENFRPVLFLVKSNNVLHYVAIKLEDK